VTHAPCTVLRMTTSPTERVGAPKKGTATIVWGLLGERRLTAKALADTIGMSKSALGRRLTGEKDFTVQELKAVAAALGVPAHTLLGEDVAA
jgi:antitoxin component HigA of HigAB toxin-antitoxin module